MALSNYHSYSATLLKEQMMNGKFANLRWFQYESMGGGRSGSRFSPMWTRQDGASGFQFGNETEARTWFNASFGAAFPAKRGHADEQPFLSFSAACTEFGRNLLEMLGDDASPIGLIQSAVRPTAQPCASATSSKKKSHGMMLTMYVRVADWWLYDRGLELQ